MKMKRKRTAIIFSSLMVFVVCSLCLICAIFIAQQSILDSVIFTISTSEPSEPSGVYADPSLWVDAWTQSGLQKGTRGDEYYSYWIDEWEITDVRTGEVLGIFSFPKDFTELIYNEDGSYYLDIYFVDTWSLILSMYCVDTGEVWAISFTNSAVDDGFVSPFFIGARQ